MYNIIKNINNIVKLNIIKIIFRYNNKIKKKKKKKKKKK